MQRSIWKYEFKVTDSFSIDMPKDAEVLCVQVQGNRPVMWAVVDPKEPTEPRKFRVHGTGHPILTDKINYIGTIQEAGGSLIWHVFESEEDDA